jgi:capsular polysaccharide biosynthesis protein
MLRSLRVPDLFSGITSNIAFHFPDKGVNTGSLLDEMTGGLSVRAGCPDRVLELNDVFVVPGRDFQCLYDGDGRRISESRVWRGDGEYIDSDHERIKLPSEFARIDEPVLYLSSYFNHWGHFLTESLSRLWARAAHPELRHLAVCFAGLSRPREQDINPAAFFHAPSAEMRFIEARAPARLAKCFVPAPSFINRACAHRAHLLAPREIAEAYLAGEARTASDQPVYLSRARIANGGRVINNEAEVETLLAKAGVTIVHPERLTLREQIVLFNTRKTFIGCVGSAFHTTMFALAGPGLTTHVLSQKWHNRNCLMMDAIVGNASHYVSVLQRVPAQRAEREVEFEIDVPFAAEYFRGAGII